MRDAQPHALSTGRHARELALALAETRELLQRIELWSYDFSADRADKALEQFARDAKLLRRRHDVAFSHAELQA